MVTTICQILILLLCLNIIYTTHFQGGTITYKILDTNGSTVSILITQTYLFRWATIYCDNSLILSQSEPNISTYASYSANLTCVSSCNTTGGYNPVPIKTYCTDYSSAMAISVTERTDIVNLTNDANFTVAFVSYVPIPIYLITCLFFLIFYRAAWRTLSLPINGSASKGWSIACTIDLAPRSDNGKPNTPPVATVISPIYIPVGSRTSITIPTIDGDNDVVRCRFADATTECADVCPPDSLPNNTILISSNCTLLITGAYVNDWYAVAIQVRNKLSKKL